MKVIPVLDIRSGVVVHARGGQRAAYLPIDTPLAPGSSDPAAVVAGYLTIYPFDTVYVADLDGIGGSGRNHDTVCALRLEFPGITFWVDDGSATSASVAALARMPNVRPVVGSETLGSPGDLASLLDAGRRGGMAEPVLSLDFKGRTFRGPDGLLHSPVLWPATVIAMTLAKVGSGAGPDLVCFKHLKADKPDADIVVAGGVRDKADLIALREAGAAGVLVASALHAGKITAGDLEEIAGR